MSSATPIIQYNHEGPSPANIGPLTLLPKILPTKHFLLTKWCDDAADWLAVLE